VAARFIQCLCDPDRLLSSCEIFTDVLGGDGCDAEFGELIAENG